MTKAEIGEIRSRCEAAKDVIENLIASHGETLGHHICKLFIDTNDDLFNVLNVYEELQADLERETAGRSYLNKALNSTKQELDYFKSVLKGKKKNAVIVDLKAERDRHKSRIDELEKANDCLRSQLSALQQLCELHKIIPEAN